MLAPRVDLAEQAVGIPIAAAAAAKLLANNARPESNRFALSNEHGRGERGKCAQSHKVILPVRA